MVFLTDTPKRSPVQRLLRFFLGTVVVVGIAWGVVSLPYDILREERARLYGEKSTTGQVVSVQADESDSHPGARLLVEYHYVDPDGFSHTATARLPDNLWQRYRKGAVIRVIYVHNRPEIVRLPDEVEPSFQVWLRNLME